MFFLSRALAKDKAGGQPLRTVWKTLEDKGAYFRRGQLGLIAAAPGVGKSAFALNLMIRSGAKGLYFSADSGAGTQLSRTCSISLGLPLSEAMNRIEDGHLFEQELDQLKRIRWDFDAGPTLESIEDKVHAYAYLHGEYPELIIVDNLMDVVSDEEGDYKSMDSILQFLKEIARMTGALVLVLHHLTGEYEDGDKPPPLSSLRGKVGKIPELVLTLWNPPNGGMGVAILKNRGGQASAAATYTVELSTDLSLMSIKDYEESYRAPTEFSWTREQVEALHGS